MRIVSVVGARPQFIKASAASKTFLNYPLIEELVIHTGQHFDPAMSAVFFEELKIPKPAASFDINGGTHGVMTGRMLVEMDELLIDAKPDLVLVYGDTNSTLAGAVSAAKMHIPVAHVEAGLRSYNMKMPEEINRILTDNVSDFLFCPTDQAIENLRQEGFHKRPCDIVWSGDIMLDAMQSFRPFARAPESAPEPGYILATIHRAENTDDSSRLREIVEALNVLHRDHAPVVMPVHPRTKKAMDSCGLELAAHTLSPVGYLEMLWLLEHAALVMTDSGGLQKEAYFFDKPCLTVRDQTEWVELVRAGANILTPAGTEDILENARRALNLAFTADLSQYGEGRCAEAIAEHILRKA